MFNINIVKWMFALLALSTSIFGLLINYLESFLPPFIIQTYRYGKFAYKGKHSYFLEYLEVPKKWFRHFYIVATLFSTYILIVAINGYFFGIPVPSLIVKYLNFISAARKINNNATSTFLALILFNIHCWRRLYETYLISVFSATKINIVHYIIGIIHYIGAASAIIAETQLFANPFENRNNVKLLKFSDINNWHSYIGIMCFIWAWYHQYKSAIILANLRKDERGKILTYTHKIPMGDLFNLISAPHLFCEAILYLALWMILWGNSTFPYIVGWVLTNQCECALLSHWWYKSNFKDYPKNRHAFIPFFL